MAGSLKRYIRKGIGQNIPLGRIKRDLAKKGYSMEEINKASREVIAGSGKLNVKVIGVFGLVVGIVVITFLMYGYKPTEQTGESVSIPAGESGSANEQIALFCGEFREVDYEVSCEEAVEAALLHTPGIIQNVSIISISVPDSVTDYRTLKSRKLWMTDIKVYEPYFDDVFGKRIELLRVGVLVDGPKDAFYKEPIKAGEET